MKLKFIEADKRWIIGFGVFSPGWSDKVEDELGERLLKTGHFKEIKKVEIKKVEIKKVERKIRQKSKKKGVKDNEYTQTHRNQKRNYLGN